jgi:hypothetical protein
MQPEEAWFDLQMMQKDPRLALEGARELHVPLPSTAVADELRSAARGLRCIGLERRGETDSCGIFCAVVCVRWFRFPTCGDRRGGALVPAMSCSRRGRIRLAVRAFSPERAASGYGR